jgi:hypothetical protein
MAYIARLDGFCLRHSPNLLGKAAPLTHLNMNAPKLCTENKYWLVGVEYAK